MHYFSIVLFLLAGGLAWRIRGQSEPWSDSVSRYVIWGIPVGGLVGLCTHNPYYGIASVTLAGLGASLGYWGQFDFSTPANFNIRNYAMLTATAMFRFFPLFIASYFVGLQWHVLPAVLTGISFVPIYILAYKYMKWNINPYFNQPSCYGEFLFGAIIYTTLEVFL